jgi:hypothetical protein
VRDSLLRGEAPIASHLLYTQPGVLNDQVADERRPGIEAGLAWRVAAEATVVYQDLGISPGMEHGIAAAKAAGLPVEYRTLPPSFSLAKSRVRRVRSKISLSDAATEPASAVRGLRGAQEISTN